MPHMHFLGNVGRAEIDDDPLLLHFRVANALEQLVDLCLDEFVMQPDLNEALLVSLHVTDHIVRLHGIDNVLSELLKSLESQRCSLLLVLVDIELLDGKRCEIFVVLPQLVLQKHIWFDGGKSLCHTAMQHLLHQPANEPELVCLHWMKSVLYSW